MIHDTDFVFGINYNVGCVDKVRMTTRATLRLSCDFPVTGVTGE